jgi:uncharacterized protein (DUF1697 family)
MSEIQIALIRGINVGKAKRLPMAGLRELCVNLGFKNVKTLLNSGNIVFTTARVTAAKSARMIEDAIFDSYAISARVIVLTADELAEIVEKNSLLKIMLDPSRLLVTVLEKASDAKNLKKFEKQTKKPEALAVGKRAVYQWCPNGILKSGCAQAVAHELGDTATARNWATMTKLYSMVNES